MNRQKFGLPFGLFLLILFFLLALTISFSGCELPEEHEPDPELQEEFLSWAGPIYRQVERSDQDWMFLSKSIVFYADDEEDVEVVEERNRVSILLHQELLEEVDTSTDNPHELAIIEQSKALFQARLQASLEIQEYLDRGEKPDLKSAVFVQIRESTQELATTFESIMKEYDVVWAHLRYYN